MRQIITAESSQKIKNMSLLCAFLVVGIHTDWPHDLPFSLGWFMHEVLGSGFSAIAVPFFFVVSGYFLAQHFDEDKWWECEVKKRIKSLIIPFCLWTAIDFALTTPLSIVADKMAGRPFGESIYWLHNLVAATGLSLVDYPGLIPLWYVRCLFIFVLLSALFKWGVSKLKYLWLAVLFCLCVFNNFSGNMKEFFSVGFSISGAFYFSVGIFINRQGIVNCKRPIYAIACWIVGVALLSVHVVYDYRGDASPIRFVALAIPFFIYATWQVIPSRKLPSWLTACSFPIYLMHMILMTYMGIILKRLSFDELTNAFIVFLGSIAGSMAVTLLLRRLMPRFAIVLFGGR